jgi:BRCA1 C Terminus (BRCT) domain
MEGASRLVTFTGESDYAVQGVRLDHLGQQFLARKAGCTTWPRVTKRVQLCVTSDPETVTGKLGKAEEYGIDVISESDFWAELGLNLERL